MGYDTYSGLNLKPVLLLTLQQDQMRIPSASAAFYHNLIKDRSTLILSIHFIVTDYINIQSFYLDAPPFLCRFEDTVEMRQEIYNHASTNGFQIRISRDVKGKN